MINQKEIGKLIREKLITNNQRQGKLRENKNLLNKRLELELEIELDLDTVPGKCTQGKDTDTP